MLLNVRSTAIRIAVVAFFALSIISWLSELSPYSCCKRAMLGAICVFFTTKIAAKAINAILLNAMITNKENQKKENNSDGGN